MTGKLPSLPPPAWRDNHTAAAPLRRACEVLA